MTTTTPTENRIGRYLSDLEKALRGITPSEKQEVIREIRAHILDSISDAADPEGALDRVLRLLGEPKELADRYSTESLLTRASRSFSPWLLLRTSWRWAKMGLKGTLAFFLAFFGYAVALAFTVSVILKPFMPSRVGLWLTHDSLSVGTTNVSGAHELLGEWFVPVMAASAFAIAVGTTHALRWLFSKRSVKAVY